MAHFAVRLTHGPNWDTARAIRHQEGWDEHAAFMDGLVADGFIIIGGPVGDGEQTLHAVEAADENQVRACLAGDPWALSGLLQVAAIEPWALWLDGRAGDPAGGDRYVADTPEPGNAAYRMRPEHWLSQDQRKGQTGG
jgi:uncharacterized protein YciI